MKDLLRFARDVLLFKDEAYARHATRPDVLKRGLAVLVLVSLFAGSLSLVVNVINGVQPVDIEAQRREMEQSIQEFIQTWQQFSELPSGVDQQIEDFQAGVEIGFRIAELPTPLPKPLGRVLTSVGNFLSLPFARMARWMGYSVFVLLVAKLLGGRATVSQMLGTTALYAIPHALRFLSLIPCLGGLLGLVATVWGIAIYVKAVAVANELSLGRAVVAVIAPALVGVVLGALGGLFLLILALIG